MTTMTQAQYNANLTVNKFRGNVSEFPMLKGILCLNHGYEYDQAMRVTAVIDLMVIAYRMDDLAKDKTIIGPLYYTRTKEGA